MNSKIGVELSIQIKTALEENPKREIPIIITLKPGTDSSILERQGLIIENIIESISVVSGVISASEIYDLSKLEEIELIEFDGPVYALDED